jgi:hypothetical protein
MAVGLGVRNVTNVAIGRSKIETTCVIIYLLGEWYEWLESGEVC